MENTNEKPQPTCEGRGAPEAVIGARTPRSDQINTLLAELQTAKGERHEEILAILKTF